MSEASVFVLRFPTSACQSAEKACCFAIVAKAFIIRQFFKIMLFRVNNTPLQNSLAEFLLCFHLQNFFKTHYKYKSLMLSRDIKIYQTYILANHGNHVLISCSCYKIIQPVWIFRHLTN